MFNRIVGILFTIAVFLVLGFAILNWGNYRSLLFDNASSAANVEAIVESGEEVDVEAVEDAAMVQTTDSLSLPEVVNPDIVG